jgi:segregation and condensation protein B
MAKNPKDSNDTNKNNSSMVSIVEDPYGISTLEVAEAQRDSGELDLDDDLLDLETSDEEADTLEATDSDSDSDSDSELEEEREDAELVLADEDPEAMNNLEQAISASEAASALEAQGSVISGISEEDAAKELARQIAEDEALQKSLAEADEQDEQNDAELQAALPTVNESGELDLAEVQSCIESLLFISDKAISVEKLRELLGPNFTPAIFQEAITELCDRYKQTHHGIELVKVGGGYQFRTKPGRAPLARKLAKIQSQRLSGGAMESLAIIAYKQPVLKDDIDKIRGVDSSYFIRGLLDKKLIKISGRSELPGRPMLYSTTHEFLEVFGLADLSAMPALRELENMVPASIAKGEEDPRVKEMRQLVNQMTTDTSTSLNYDPKEDEKLLQEIRERVNAIPSSTPTLDAQKDAQKEAAKEEMKAKLAGHSAEAAPELPLVPELAIAPEHVIEIPTETAPVELV